MTQYNYGISVTGEVLATLERCTNVRAENSLRRFGYTTSIADIGYTVTFVVTHESYSHRHPVFGQGHCLWPPAFLRPNIPHLTVLLDANRRYILYSFAQDCAVMGINLHQLKKQKAAGRLLYVLSQARYTSLARALRTWVVWVVDGIHLKRVRYIRSHYLLSVRLCAFVGSNLSVTSKYFQMLIPEAVHNVPTSAAQTRNREQYAKILKHPCPSAPSTSAVQQTRLQKDHASDVLSLEKDLHGAEARCRDARQRNDALRDSRAAVAEAIAIAGRRRGGLAAAAGERGDPALQWCFWGWARLARGGFAARATRARRIEAEKELQGVREMRQALVERARGAETERDRYM